MEFVVIPHVRAESASMEPAWAKAEQAATAAAPAARAMGEVGESAALVMAEVGESAAQVMVEVAVWEVLAAKLARAAAQVPQVQVALQELAAKAAMRDLRAMVAVQAPVTAPRVISPQTLVPVRHPARLRILPRRP